jgi:pyrroloquinoline quinone biosynthesis protein D
MNTLPEQALRIAPGLRLQWEEAQQAHVLLYPEGMVQLNPSSAEILGRCNGRHSAETIVAELEQEFPDADLADDVREFLATALANGWIVTA